MTRQFRAPDSYVQGGGVLETAAAHLEPLDVDRALLAGGDTALSTAGEPLLDALADAGVEHAGTVPGVSTATEEQVSAIDRRADGADADLLVGVGGGTAVDAAKAAATRAGLDFVSVPTVASTDAPASSISVLYDGSGAPAGTETRDRPPELVLVDTAVVADAPVRFLRQGIGDALATTFEAEACAASGATTPHDTDPTDAGLVLARRCYEVIERDGVEALAAVGRGEATPAVEATVETALLHSALGFENAGLAGAHSVEIGLRLAGVTGPPHGTLVGVCTLAQLVWEEHAAREEVASLLAALGFEYGIPADADLETAAEFACSDVTMMANEPVEVTPADVVAALETSGELLETAR